jgi:hypothetical protein
MPLVRGLQQTVGNQTVQRMLVQRSGGGASVLDDETAAAIERERGSGVSLDAGIASRAGAVMGADFDEVAIHTDASADTLSRQLGATAFTTGKDIFFREGAYESWQQRRSAINRPRANPCRCSRGALRRQSKVRWRSTIPMTPLRRRRMPSPSEVMSVQRQEAEEEELLQMQESGEEELLQMQEIEEEEELL